jgi:mannosyltransferase OCH1-like enzyme
MIPKKIHYVWFGREIPPEIQNYIDNWKRKMPDYEIICWNAGNFDVSKYKWVEQAVNHKKWAFAADFIRFWAIYKYGGIYLDTDVEVVKSFDTLLHLPYFLGMEKTKQLIGSATFGAVPECAWVKDCLDYYEDRNFEIGQNIFDMEPVPNIMRKIFKKKYGFSRIKNPTEFNLDSKQIQLLPADYFSPKFWNTKTVNITENTYSIHHYEASWHFAKDYIKKYGKYWKLFFTIAHPFTALELFFGKITKKKV